MRDNTKYSSYWLKDDLFDDNTSDDVIENKQSNLLALSSYKRAISNFVNIVTNENIKVTFDERGADSYTDGKSVVISAKMDDKEFDPTVGLALHEGSHIKLTNFDTLGTINNYIANVVGYELITELMEKHSKDEFQTKNYIKDIVKNLLNVIEDRRIDYYVYSTSPGYKGYYHAMYDKYFNAKIIDKGLQSSEYRELDWESYMFRIINITNEHRDLDALPELRAVWDMLDLKNIQRLTNTEESMKLAASIFKLIENSLPADQKPIESPNEQEGEGDGESDDEQSEGSGTGGGGDNSDTNGTDNTEGNGGEPKDGSNDTDDTKGDADGDDTQSGSTSYNPNGAGGDGSNNQIADNKVESSEGEGRMSDRQKKQLDNAIKKQKDFQNGDIKKKKVSKNENKKIETLAKSGIEEKLAGEGYKSADYWRKDKKIPVMIIRNFTKQLAESNTINMLSTWEYRCADNQIPINKGIQIGTMLGRKLKLRSEERSLTTPRMKNGKISGRLLHELGMGNTNVFDQIVVDKHSPALVHISIDASSSMGGKKWDNSQTAAVAIAKAASMTPNLNVVISYRSIQSNGGTNGNVQPLMLIAYDSRTDKFSKIQQLFQYLNPCGTTPEGLCFESILDEITKTSKGIDSYFINFSDGYPGFSNSDMDYYGAAAIAHTSTQVKKMQMAGVKVLSYFIEESGYGNAMESFKEMYGKSAENVNVTSVIPLTKTLNKLFQ